MASSYTEAKPSLSPQPIQLFLDFDGTITEKDTMAILAQTGYDRQKRVERHTHLRPWDDIVKAYLDDFKVHHQKYVPRAEDRRTIVDEIKWLSSLEDTEVASARRANDEHIFDDVRTEDLEESAENAVKGGAIRLRSGFDGLISAVVAHNQRCSGLQNDDCVHVLSVNWSRHFVGSVILSARQRHSTTNISGSFNIYANELPSIVRDKRLGDNYGGYPVNMRTSVQKVEVMKKVIAERAQRGNNSTTPITLYVGDSATDLQCLLAADYGVCIRDEPLSSGQKEVKESCERLGIRVQDLMRPASDPDTEVRPVFLTYAKDFDNISEWLEAYLLS